MTMASQTTLTGTATTKLATALSSQAVIQLSFTPPSTVAITNFPTIKYPAQTANGLTITTTVSPLDPANTGEAGTFNAADGSIFIPKVTLQVTVNISGSYPTASGPVPVNTTQTGYLVTDLTTGLASSDPFDAGTSFNDQGSPVQPSGRVRLVGDGHFWDDDGNIVTFLGMSSGAISLAGSISPPPTMTTVPDVVGDTLERAKVALSAAQLNVSVEYDSALTSNVAYVPIVEFQTPEAGQVVPVGSEVVITVKAYGKPHEPAEEQAPAAPPEPEGPA